MTRQARIHNFSFETAQKCVQRMELLLCLMLYLSEIISPKSATSNKELFAQLRSFPCGVVCAGSINT